MAEKLVFIVDDEEPLRRMVSQKITKSWGYRARSFGNGETALAALDDAPDAILLDLSLGELGGIEFYKEVRRRNPDIPVIMLAEAEIPQLVTEAIKLGAVSILSKPIDFTQLEVALKTASKLSRISKELARMSESMEETVSSGSLIAESRPMQLVERLIGKIKDTDMTVLITGESGSGKEMVARAIHFTGKRRRGPFVVLNCAAIPADLLESELFGHERGAFTGATQRKVGKFEQADGGTIFLDEIGDLDLALQAKLLRVLQYKEIERVGGDRTIKIDARILAATNRNLKESVKKKLFREDLYYRLASFPIHMPSLRERGPDIIILAESFVSKYADEFSRSVKGFTREAIEIMYHYPWPGNVRELESAVKRAVILAEDELITAQDLPVVAQPFKDSSMELEVEGRLFHDNKIVPLDKIKEQAIRRAVEITRGNLAQTARQLEISRSTLYKLIEKYKVKL